MTEIVQWLTHSNVVWPRLKHEQSYNRSTLVIFRAAEGYTLSLEPHQANYIPVVIQRLPVVAFADNRTGREIPLQGRHTILEVTVHVSWMPFIHRVNALQSGSGTHGVWKDTCYSFRNRHRCFLPAPVLNTMIR